MTRTGTRREFVRSGALGLFGLGAGELLAARSAARAATPPGGSFGRAKSCILLFMWGGPAHQDTWDLKPDAPAEIRGEFSPISTNVPGTQICEHLPLLAQRTDRLAIVRSLTHTDVNHLTSTHYLLTGHAPPPVEDFNRDWPHLGAVVSRLGLGRSVLPPFVSLRPKPFVENDVPRFVEQSRGQFGGWLGPQYGPLSIDADPSGPDYRVADFALPDDFPLGRLDERSELLAAMNGLARPLPPTRRQEVELGTMAAHYQRAFELLHSTSAGSAFDLTDESQATRERYGLHAHGQSVLQARRLVERGVPLVTVYWPSEGIKNVSVYWDTHSRNFVDLKTRLMPPADQTFAALLDDLAERGLLDETLVVWTGEFGRTPRIGQVNSDAGAGADGRDHWPGCFSAVLAGAGVQGGQVYGASDRYAAYPARDRVTPLDFVATIYHLLGIPADLALEDQEGRPQFVCPGSYIPHLVT